MIKYNLIKTYFKNKNKSNHYIKYSHLSCPSGKSNPNLSPKHHSEQNPQQPIPLNPGKPSLQKVVFAFPNQCQKSKNKISFLKIQYNISEHLNFICFVLSTLSSEKESQAAQLLCQCFFATEEVTDKHESKTIH